MRKLSRSAYEELRNGQPAKCSRWSVSARRSSRRKGTHDHHRVHDHARRSGLPDPGRRSVPRHPQGHPRRAVRRHVDGRQHRPVGPLRPRGPRRPHHLGRRRPRIARPPRGQHHRSGSRTAPAGARERDLHRPRTPRGDVRVGHRPRRCHDRRCGHRAATAAPAPPPRPRPIHQLIPRAHRPRGARS